VSIRGRVSRGAGRARSWRQVAGTGVGLRLELPAGLDGRRRRIRRGGFATRKVAEGALAVLRSPDQAKSLSVSDWLTHWLATRNRASSTVRGYAGHVRLYLSAYLGQILLTELSVAQVYAMFTAIARHHEGLGKPVTPATVNRIRATLRTALNAAVRQGLIADNAASRVELPGARRPRAVVWASARIEHWERTGERPSVAVWTAALTAQFLTAIAEHRLYAAYHSPRAATSATAGPARPPRPRDAGSARPPALPPPATPMPACARPSATRRPAAPNPASRPSCRAAAPAPDPASAPASATGPPGHRAALAPRPGRRPARRAVPAQTPRPASNCPLDPRLGPSPGPRTGAVSLRTGR
jgi:hypothetical protein